MSDPLIGGRVTIPLWMTRPDAAAFAIRDVAVVGVDALRRLLAIVGTLPDAEQGLDNDDLQREEQHDEVD